jgi:hypothetical protein
MGYRVGFGVSVIRPAAALGIAGDHNIFTITGAVVITHLEGLIVGTPMDATATSLILSHDVGPTDLCAVLGAIASDPVGTIYIITGTLANALVAIDPTAAGVVALGFMTAVRAFAGNIYYTTVDTQVGTVQWEICYQPLTPDGLVVAA